MLPLVMFGCKCTFNAAFHTGKSKVRTHYQDGGQTVIMGYKHRSSSRNANPINAAVSLVGDGEDKCTRMTVIAKIQGHSVGKENGCGSIDGCDCIFAFLCKMT
jgi:hypothetical protein